MVVFFWRWNPNKKNCILNSKIDTIWISWRDKFRAWYENVRNAMQKHCDEVKGNGHFSWINEDKTTRWRKNGVCAFSCCHCLDLSFFIRNEKYTHFLISVTWTESISPTYTKSLSKFAWQNSELMRRWRTRSMKRSVSAQLKRQQLFCVS